MSARAGTVEPGLVGSCVRLVASEGEYTGTVHAVDMRDGALTLTGVTFNCGHHSEPVRGPQKFLRGDVRKIDVLKAGPDSPVPEVKISPAVRPSNDKMVMKRASRDSTVIPTYSSELVDDSLLLSQLALGSDAEEDGCEVGDGASAGQDAASPPPLLPRPSGFAVIDSTGEDLDDAIGYLLRQEQVGVSAEGVLLGRGGQLSLLTAACGEFVFIFDLVALGGAGVMALSPLLQSHSILKIVHDCRALADLLAHQHSVRLVNVFDTQVAEVYIYHQQHGKVPAYAADVAHTLIRQLGLLPTQVFLPRYRIEKMAEDQQVWMRRPLADQLLEGAVKNAVYLRELRHVQVERMFRTYVRCVDVHLGSVRDGDDEDAAIAPMESHRVPVAVQRLLDAPPRPHAFAVSDPDNPRVDTNVQGDIGAPVGFTRNVWRPSTVP